MKLSAILTMLLIGAFACAQSHPLANEKPEAEKEPMVYVTVSGERYHRKSCSFLNTRIAIERDEARKKGFTECKTCRPDDPAMDEEAKDEAMRCRQTLDNGNRCKRRARSGGYCWQHGG